MEDVPDTYREPYDPARPVVCVDGGGERLTGDGREPLPVRAGSPAERDSEYVRGGVANLSAASEPLAGWRQVAVPERETRVDFARFPRVLSEGCDPDAEPILRVCDHRGTHTPAGRSEAFEPAAARRLAGRFEWHYTPRHGSWLNMAEPEVSALARQCLDRPIPALAPRAREVAGWESARSEASAGVDWQFTSAGARIKLKKLYPTIQLQ